MADSRSAREAASRGAREAAGSEHRRPHARTPRRPPNPVLVFLGALCLMLFGVFAPGPVGAVILLLVVALLGGLLASTWQDVRKESRIVRIVILAGLVVFAVVKLI